MNAILAECVLAQLQAIGVTDVSVCPGGRNAPFVSLLSGSTQFCSFWWYEERSAAFFSLGKAKLHNRPAAVVTTSGTAAGELLPAAMEGYYSGVPLLLITADRPRRFRGTGAPQAAEQVGLFGIYTPFFQDLAKNEKCDLSAWDQTAPAHLNICFEEPLL